MINRALFIAFLSTLSSLAFAQGIQEDFDSRTTGQSLPMDADTGWSQDSVQGEKSADAGSAVIVDEEGNQYLSLTQRQTFVRYQEGQTLWEEANGPLVFRMDFRMDGSMPIDSMRPVPIDVMLHNGRHSAGYRIVINGGKQTVSVSQGGGTSVAHADMKDYSLPNLKQGVWYTLEIRDVKLSSDRKNKVGGKLYLYEQGYPAKALLDGVDIFSEGSWPFREINTLQIRRWGNNKVTLDVDNVELGNS